MIVVVDYGLGNLRSVSNALRFLGHEHRVSAAPEDLERAEKLILPGVGSFAAGMAELRQRGLVEGLEREVRQRGKPILGICLGAQLFARESEEGGRHEGLGWIDARVRRLRPADPELKVPHVGWSPVDADPDPLFAGLDGGASFYFVHSYALDCADPAQVVGRCDHGGVFPAVVRHGAVVGTQFHPEKSKNAGLRLLQNFLEA